MKTALVLSGGGMFGAWQAGAWRALAAQLKPDLVVGASVGSLNGYAIAGGATPEELTQFWMQPEIADFRRLPETIQELMKRFPLRTPYAVTLTDLWRMKPRVFRDGEITWQHIAGSCAIPLVLPMRKIDRRRYADGGLLNPLPVYAAVELGATRIVALHALPEIPASVMKPMVSIFRATFGHNPPTPDKVELIMIKTPAPLGSIRDALYWKRNNIEAWLDAGFAAAKNISIPNCIER